MNLNIAPKNDLLCIVMLLLVLLLCVEYEPQLQLLPSQGKRTNTLARTLSLRSWYKIFLVCTYSELYDMVIEQLLQFTPNCAFAENPLKTFEYSINIVVLGAKVILYCFGHVGRRIALFHNEYNTALRLNPTTIYRLHISLVSSRSVGQQET